MLKKLCKLLFINFLGHFVAIQLAISQLRTGKHLLIYHDHKIDFENGKVIDSGNYRTRKTLESWHTALITNSDNYSKPIPKQYATLIRKICNR